MEQLLDDVWIRGVQSDADSTGMSRLDGAADADVVMPIRFGSCHSLTYKNELGNGRVKQHVECMVTERLVLHELRCWRAAGHKNMHGLCWNV